MSGTPPLRACLLSGGASRRMGRDKALLPHPEGDTWLERTLRLLQELEVPITLLSRHPAHLELAQALNRGQAASAPCRVRTERITAIAEPPPWEGPLLALHRLMELHPGARLLVCPVDMPALRLGVLQALCDAAAKEPLRIHLAHDRQRRQPLLGLYPGDEAIRLSLAQALDSGERRLQTWLACQPCREVRLDSWALRNVNRPEQLQSGWERR